MTVIRVAIFASGNGSNAEALIKKAKSLSNKIQISCVICDKPEAGVLKRASGLGVKSFVVPRATTKNVQEDQILDILQKEKTDWIFLAGYMRLLSANFIDTFAKSIGTPHQIVNIHPSLLPLYPGVDSIARAFDDGRLEFGVTLHYVDDGIDTGKIIIQEKITRSPSETLESLKTRIHDLEHRLYTKLLEDIAEGRMQTQSFQHSSSGV